MAHKQQTCTCTAYPFPHRQGGGNCNSCRHGKDWQGLSAALNDEGEWCSDCAAEEGYRGEPSECLTDWERNPSFRSW